MKIKTKLRLGFMFLFLMVFLLAGLSGYYLYDISASSKVILKNNYESLNYARGMRNVLDNEPVPLSREAAIRFDEYLKQQEGNITERGEKELTQAIRNHFRQLSTDTGRSMELLKAMRNDLHKIEQLNMDAIVRKTEIAHRSVNRATTYMGAISCVIILILFSFSVNFPGFIANPLLQLTEGIKEITRKNYTTRLNFPVNDEFGPLATAFNHMATKLSEWENSNLAKVISEKQRIETIVNRMQDGIIGIDEQNRILFINPVAERLLNLSEEHVADKSVIELVKTNDLLKNILKDQVPDKALKIFANGRESFFQLEKQAIMVPSLKRSEEGQLPITTDSAGEVIILKNVTHFKELDEAKTNFIATISHELKTPISSIKMSLKLLDDQRIGELNKEQKDLVTHIGNDAQRLLKITGELLDLSQAESGNIQLNVAPSSPEEIVNYAISALQTQADEKKIAIEYINETNNRMVQADKEKTTWVLINFLSNALRYSPEEGRIEIKVSETDQMLEFSVSDHGKGIEEKYVPRLFERYFQVPTDGRNKSGSGLGLAISKDFIEAQGGTITAKSELGYGSYFSFRLPFAKS